MRNINCIIFAIVQVHPLIRLFPDPIDDSVKCDQTVTQEKWSNLFPFLTEIRADEICFILYKEGNYTGQVTPYGERHGWGEMLWSNGTLYGPDNIFFYSTGDRYLGQWKYNLQHGIGTFSSQTGIYIGTWKEGIQEGNGTALYDNGNKYSGQFRNGFKEGMGKFEVVNGDIYTGNFISGMRNGQGIETFHNGEMYVGMYLDDKQHGQGTAYYPNGQVKYVGEWHDGSPNGNGTYLALNGDRYVGMFRSGVVSGPGTIYEVNGNVRELQDNESITFRHTGNKYMQLVTTIADYLGLNSFIQKYTTFFNNLGVRSLF